VSQLGSFLLIRASKCSERTVATYQTLLESERLRKFSPQSFKAIIVDEAHHAAAPSYANIQTSSFAPCDYLPFRFRYRRILSFFHPEVQCPENPTHPSPIQHPVPIFGFSATFSRHDGLALGSVFERIVYHRDFLDMIKEEW